MRKYFKNSFDALKEIEDADALQEEIAALELRRSGKEAACSRHSTTESNFLRQPLIWIDLEMTGLDVEKDSILQIACIITEGDLERQVEGPEITIHYDEEVLQSMNDWCKEQHGKSGLTQAVRDSTVSLCEAEQQVLEFVQRHVPEPSKGVIAGNSVHVDLAFLKRHMPSLAEHLHYRIVDVSTLGELCKRWFPKEHNKAPRKKNTHTAISDVRESIHQLKYYRNHIFKKWSGLGAPTR